MGGLTAEGIIGQERADRCLCRAPMAHRGEAGLPGIRIVLNGGESGNGGYVGTVVARFGDGAVQPMGFAKFIYSCASHAFVHVVIVSAKEASPA